MPNQILVTGANGFIGRRLVHILSTHGYLVRRCTRDFAEDSDVAVGGIGPDTDWSTAITGINTIIHLAGRAHILKETISDSLEEFRCTNVDGSLTLAQQAVEAGVKRFIFISSIGVNGNKNTAPFTEDDIPEPQEPYAVSKLEAEEGLQRIAERSSMDVVILRPPLVYGPGAPGNFRRLIQAVAKRVPLPLASANNQRSFVALDNLVDFIVTCVGHPDAANQIFLVADGEDLSTVELLRRIAEVLGVTARLFPVPVWLLKVVALLLGRQGVARSLCDSLRVDISKSRELLNWEPPVSVDSALQLAAQEFLKSQGMEHNN